jgi:integrase
MVGVARRDSTMILMAFRHGLRAAELVDLRWDQVDLGRNACLHVRRVKNGIATTHPLQGDEMRALRALKRQSSFVFVSERGAPFTKAGCSRRLMGFVSLAENHLLSCTASQQNESVDVCFGSKADIGACPRDVRFTPKSRHWNSAV